VLDPLIEMILSKNFFSKRFEFPRGFDSIPTSALIEDGVFCHYMDRGVPFYMPIGKKIVDNLERIMTEESEKSDVPVIEIPAVFRNDVLEKGETLGDIFRSKVFYLSGEREGMHMFTTPEPFVLELAVHALESHNQLPQLNTYHTQVFRGLPRPKGVLKGIQFKTFMGHSIDENQDSIKRSIERFESLTDNIFNRLGIKTSKVRKEKGVNLEYYYFCDEGDNLEIPEISDQRVSALSLAMVYQYCPDKQLWIKVRNKENRNSRVLYATYGLGTQRVFYSVLNSHRDNLGFNLPREVAPYVVSIIPQRESDIERSNIAYDAFKQNSIGALLDDRKKTDTPDKLRFSDYIGIRHKAIVSESSITLKSRDGDIKLKDVSMQEAIRFICEVRK